MEQENYAKLNLGTECIWELDLVALEGLERNSIINVATNEGNWCINEDITFDYVHAYPSFSTHGPLL